MNDETSRNNAAMSLEMRLAAHPPRISPVEKDALLYACAFAAGRDAGRRNMRRWQTAFALSVGLLATAVPLVWHPSQQVADRQLTARSSGSGRSEQAELTEAPVKVVTSLDAWQRLPDEFTPLSTALEEYKHIDSHSQTLSVTSLTRNLQAP